MQVAKDSKKRKSICNGRHTETNDFGSDKNESRSIDVSAGYTGSDSQ